MRHRHWAIGLIASALALGTAPAIASSGVERGFVPTPGHVTPPDPGLGPFPDLRLEERPALPPKLRRAPEQAYTAPGGETVYVTVSDYYAPDPAADQALVNFFGGLTHGAELNGLRVSVVSPDEMGAICPGAAACYDGADGRMYLTGEETFGGFPTDYSAAHEYGHHVTLHRANPPFPGSAYDWGTKRWASYQTVCPGVFAGRLFIRSQGPEEYYADPSEAWAEEYALMHFPGMFPWQFTPYLTPTTQSTALLREDVLSPWAGNKTVKFGGKVKPGKVESFRITTPLDGRLKLRLKGPSGSDFDLYLLYRNRVIKKSRGRGSRESIGFTICGQERFKIDVYAYRGGGRASVLVSRP